jgi:excinuclease ABC subunit C
MKACPPNDELTRELGAIPDAPGVYLFKDEHGVIIYIGKAAGLRSRVRSYWNVASWAERPKLAVMMPRVAHVDTILTNSEKEALILEATLVRKHMPRYNVHLKDDKRYPWLAITYDESFPRLMMVRDPVRFKQDNPKARVFGPYVETGAMWETVKVLRKVFPMRQRKTPLFKDRPCMNYYIGLCMGPCQKLVEEDFYNRMVEQVELFLAGRQKEVVFQLRQEMEQAAERLDFEQAAKIRNRLFILNRVIEKQQVFFQDSQISQDVIAEAHTDRLVCLCIMRIREGKLTSSESVCLPLADKTRWDEAFQSFVDQYYTACEDIALPKEVLLQHRLEDSEALAEMLCQRAGRQVRVQVPTRGAKTALIEMAGKNAVLSLEKQSEEDASESQKVLAALVKLKEELELTRLPRRIECFDISNIQGVDNVASMVVFENGQPRKADYRHFKIKSVEGRADDFASMKEVVGRRYRRIIEDNKALPDLVIIDGGKGQLNAALQALSELPPCEIDVIGLAKRQDEVYFPQKQEPVALPRRSEALNLLQRVRDEAHRFAVNFHRKLRARRALVSGFDALPGVGPARRKALLEHFGSFDRLKQATLEEIRAVPGVPGNLAGRIYTALHGRENDPDGSQTG